MQYRSVTVLAPAKLNLSLDVVGTLPNGYHDLDMVMQTIDLYEKITLRRSNDLSLTLPGSFVPVNDKNTAVKAALAFFDYTGLLALISSRWVFLPHLRFASRQAVANEKSPHSRASSRYDSRSFGLPCSSRIALPENSSCW